MSVTVQFVLNRRDCDEIMDDFRSQSENRRGYSWLVAAETLHRSRMIPVNLEIAHRAGILLHHAVVSGRMPSTEDAIIAATAEIHNFVLLSRNAGDMAALSPNWSNPVQMLLPGKDEDRPD